MQRKNESAAGIGESVRAERGPPRHLAPDEANSLDKIERIRASNLISDLGKADLEQAKGERHFVLSYM